MGLHITAFADKIKVMNQTNAKSLSLSAAEARSLHSEIFDILARITDLLEFELGDNDATVISDLDGGSFK